MDFANPIGLYALLSLIIFILIYLIRPKPQEKTIPSLMFLFKDVGVHRKSSFLRYFLRDLLFLIQLFALLALCFAVASPQMDMPYNMTVKETVIVLDVSASMQTKMDGTTRFDRAVEEAKKRIEGKTSIILAGNVPYTALEAGGESDAKKILDSISPTDSTSNIGDSMILAKEILKSGGKVVVLSDFIQTHGTDILVAQRALTASQIKVDLLDMGSEAKSVGITNLVVGRYTSTAFLKNFNSEPENINVKLTQDTVTKEDKTFRLEPGSVEQYEFATLPGKSTLTLSANADDLDVDNKAYISSPLSNKIRVLLITNEPNSFLRTALESSKIIDLQVAEPPIYPKIDQDVIIMNEAKKDEILIGTFREIGTRVKAGSSFVITGQKDLQSIDMEDLSPVSLSALSNETAVNVRIFNQFTQDIDFRPLNEYFTATAPNSTIVVAAAEDESPLNAYKQYGKGKIVYYGLFDKETEFTNVPSYPIFWENLVSFLTETEDIKDYNKRIMDNPTISDVGFVDMNGKSVAYNLLSEEESSVNKGTKEDKLDEDLSDFMVKASDGKKKLPLGLYLLMLASALMLFEIFYIKRRGDL